MDDRKTILATLGLALFAAGVALDGSAVAAIIDAPPKRGLKVEWVLLGLGVVMVLAAVYVFIAALSDRLPLLGMKAVRQRANDHALAVRVLAEAVGRGNHFTEVDDLDNEDVKVWIFATCDFIRATWGRKDEEIIRGGIKEMPRTVAEFGEPVTQHTTMVAVLNPILSRLERLLERCHELPLQAHYQRPWGPAWTAMMDAIDPPSTKKTSPEK